MPGNQRPANVALFDGFQTPRPTLLTVKAHSALSGKRVEILGENGMPILDCKGSAWNLTREFYAPNGQLLFLLKKHRYSRDNVFSVDTAKGTPMARVNQHLAWGKPRLDLHFRNAAAGSAGEEVMVEIRYHGFWGRETTISWNGMELASVEREGTLRVEWKVRLNAGVDQALIAAIAVIIVVVYREGVGRAAASGAAGGAGG